MENKGLQPRIIEIPRVCDPRGNLSFLQRPGCMPFDVKRVYYLYDVPCDSERGGHSHRTVSEVLIAVTGAFDVTVENGDGLTKFTLNRPYQGLLLPAGVWRTLENFTSGAVCLVLASGLYDEAEYVREYDEFKAITKARIEAAEAPKRFPFLDLGQANEAYKQALKDAACRVIDSGRYIGGCEVEDLEKEVAELCQVPYAVGVSNGLDALRLILRAYIELGRLKPGDEVIVPGDTYIASVLAITDNGLLPVYADIDLETANITAESVEAVITERTRAIMPVHLYGRVSWDEGLKILAQERNMLVIEDNAQGIGAKSRFVGLYGTEMTGGLGNAAGISFYPTKNLGALGDGGMVTTHDQRLADVVRALRNYGADRQYHNLFAGLNCRLDPIQAAMLRVKLPFLSRENGHRQILAARYDEEIHNPKVEKPQWGVEDCIWHQYVVRVADREDFRQYLKGRGVETGVHYPATPYHQPCYGNYNANCPNAELFCATCVSLPISSCTSEQDVREIAKIINDY